MNLSPVVVGIIVTVAGLILLYLVARTRKLKTFGHAIAFTCTVVARILVKSEEYLNNAAAYCKSACETALKSINDSGEWTMRDFLWRLIGFCIGLLILAGESIQVLEVLPSFFQAATVSLPPIAELSSAALFICCSALFGDIVLECWGKVRGVGLFHNMGKPSRWIVGSLSMLLLMFSDVVNGYFYIYRAEILAHIATPGLMVLILGGLGVEVSAVAPFALLAVKEGSSSVVALLMGLAGKSFKILAAFASLTPHVLDAIAIHLGGTSVYQKFDVPTLTALQPGQTTVIELPEHAASTEATIDDVQIIPVQPPKLQEEKMNKPDNASIVSVGNYGSRLYPFVVRKIDELHAKESILTSGFLDLSIAYMPTAIKGIVDISLPTPERIASTLHGKNEDETYQTALNRLGDRLVETHLSSRAHPSVLIFVIDCRLLVYATEMLERVKRRLPLHSLVVCTDLNAQNPIVHTGMVAVQSLHAENIIECVFVASPRSRFAQRFGGDTQLDFTAQVLVSLILGHRHTLSNRSFTNILQELHSMSPFAALSFASEAVALGSVSKRLKWIPGVARQDGSHAGDFTDIIMQARNAATRVLTDPDTSTFDAEVSTDAACMVLFNTPIQLNDPRFNEFSRDMALWVGSNFPNASSLTVRGNGCSYPHHLGGRFLVQASCIYPVQPASFPRLQHAKSVKVTPLYPLTTTIEPATNNGRVQTSVSNKADTKKPASSRKAKAPTRRVAVRKNTRAK